MVWFKGKFPSESQRAAEVSCWQLKVNTERFRFHSFSPKVRHRCCWIGLFCSWGTKNRKWKEMLDVEGVWTPKGAHFSQHKACFPTWFWFLKLAQRLLLQQKPINPLQLEIFLLACSRFLLKPLLYQILKYLISTMHFTQKMIWHLVGITGQKRLFNFNQVKFVSFLEKNSEKKSVLFDYGLISLKWCCYCKVQWVQQCGHLLLRVTERRYSTHFLGFCVCLNAMMVMKTVTFWNLDVFIE